MPEQDQLLKELNNLKTEIIEARNMNIKTDNAVRSLFAEMKKMSGNQETAERKMRLSSIGAYLLFVAIIATAAFLLSGIQSSLLEGRIETLNAELANTKNKIKSLTLEQESREAAGKGAAYLLKLVRSGEKVKAVREFRKMDTAKLSKVEHLVLEEHINAFRVDLAKKHYDSGVKQWRIGGYKNAIQEFETSLGYLKNAEHKGLLRYHLGLCQLQEKNIDVGIDSLKAAISAGIPRDLSNQARLKIADTYINAERYQDALDYMKGIPDEAVNSWTRYAIANKIFIVKKKLDARKQQKSNP